MLNQFFQLKENNTSVKTEILAGITTFMTMAYILAVNPDILSATGMDKNALFTATALSALVATLVMALGCPFAFCTGSGNGIECFFCFYRCSGNGIQLAICFNRCFSGRNNISVAYAVQYPGTDCECYSHFVETCRFCRNWSCLLLLSDCKMPELL